MAESGHCIQQWPQPVHFVAEHAGGRGNRAQRRERIGHGIVAAAVERADLVVEAIDVGDGRRRRGHGQTRRSLGKPGLLLARLLLDRLPVELADLVEAAPDDPDVVLHDVCAAVTEVLLQLRPDALEERLLGQLLALQDR
jgi:hypothetical protein